MGYMTTFTTKKAKFVVHSLLLLLLGHLAILLSLEERLGLLLLEEPEELVGGHPELLFKLELFFQLSNWLLGFTDLSDLSALLELGAFSWLIFE